MLRTSGTTVQARPTRCRIHSKRLLCLQDTACSAMLGNRTHVHDTRQRHTSPPRRALVEIAAMEEQRESLPLVVGYQYTYHPHEGCDKQIP